MTEKAKTIEADEDTGITCRPGEQYAAHGRLRSLQGGGRSSSLTRALLSSTRSVSEIEFPPFRINDLQILRNCVTS